MREQTGELAAWVLNDAKSIRAGTPPRQYSAQGVDYQLRRRPSQHESSKQSTDLRAREEQDEGHQPERIEEVSEPASPEDKTLDRQQPPTSSTSALTNLIRRSPPKSPSSRSEDGEYYQYHETRSLERDTKPRVFDDDDRRHEQNENSSLLPRDKSAQNYRRPSSDVESQRDEGTWKRHYGTEEQGKSSPRKASTWLVTLPSKAATKVVGVARAAGNPKSWNKKTIIENTVKAPLRALPAVGLGCLLNLLDAMSYGLILFPLGERVFAKTGPDGIGVFYVSTIVSQLVYSMGFSAFKGGVGSEMIEVIPFFHQMALTIMTTAGEANDSVVLTTTLFSYVLSSLLTGLVFFILGGFKLGQIIAFFPRHILTGSIAGVGLFLFRTGIEVSAGLDSSVEFDKTTAHKLFVGENILLWTVPLLLAIILIMMRHFIKSPFLVPAYFILVAGVFYIIIAAVPSFTIPAARKDGWIFPMPDAGVPFYHFYEYFVFSQIHWAALAKTVPAMFALTFFGIIHVPINVPALGMAVGEDDLDLNRELIAHGISNTASACVGSMQNYLVYVNSVMFIRNGGNSRQAGFMLAAATFGLWVAGPSIIGLVPKPVVGSLIYMLGLDLMIESLWSTFGIMHRLEYLTVVAMMLVMGLYDFVYGIVLGLVLACLTFVVQNSQKSAIRATYTGEVAQSTVRRHPLQRRYLRTAGRQTLVTKLAGFLFFGTIVAVENKTRAIIEEESFRDQPISYLVFDFAHVTGLDFSAAEAFDRMNRILQRRAIVMVISGVTQDSDLGRSFRSMGMWKDGSGIEFFEELNGALEACENELLKALYQRRDKLAEVTEPSEPVTMDSLKPPRHYSMDASYSSPRRDYLQQAARKILTESSAMMPSKWRSFAQPLPLLLQAFLDLNPQNEDFWYPSTKYFTKREFLAGAILYKRGDQPNGFYLLEDGLLRCEYHLPQGKFTESIVPGTTCGELPFFSGTERSATVVADKPCVTWVLETDGWEKLQVERPEIARELLRICLKLTSERMSAITS